MGRNRSAHAASAAFARLRLAPLFALCALLMLLGGNACSGVPNPDNAPDNYLRSIGFEVALKQPVLLRWRKDAMPLTVYLPPPPDELFEDNEHVQEVVRSAILIWADVVEPGVPSFEFVTDPSRVDIPVVWSSRRPLGQADAGWHVAKTIYNIQPEARRLRIARIIVTGRWEGGVVANDEEIRARVIHEVGHALGMGHSPRMGDAMYERPGSQELSARDETTLRLLYASPNGRRMVPLDH